VPFGTSTSALFAAKITPMKLCDDRLAGSNLPVEPVGGRVYPHARSRSHFEQGRVVRELQDRPRGKDSVRRQTRRQAAWKTFFLTGVLFGLVFQGTCVGSEAGQSGQELRVCVEYDEGLLVLVQALAFTQKMFDGIGVPLKWKLGLHACPPGAIRVSLINRSADVSLPNDVLGSALLAEPPHIRLFADRTHDYTSCPPSVGPYCRIAEAHVMAHVLTHEISHVLEGANRHSDLGVMKAQWDTNDFLKMKRGSLPFAPVDVQLIRAGLDRREMGSPSLDAGKPILADAHSMTIRNPNSVRCPYQRQQKTGE
jgi:hypothetical protein